MKVPWLEWYYLIYLLPLGLAFVMLMASALTGGGDESDGDVDTPDLHGDHGDVGGDADLSGDADTDLDGDAGDDAEAEGSGSPLGFLGFGQAPMSLLLQGFMLTWGVIGFYSTRLFLERLPVSTAVPAGMGAAAVCGLAGMKLIGLFGARYMKPVETYAVRWENLVGEMGVVVYPVSATMGRVHVYDRHGTLHVESVRVEEGEAPISRHAKVVLIDYDPARRTYGVKLFEHS